MQETVVEVINNSSNVDSLNTREGFLCVSVATY